MLNPEIIRHYLPKNILECLPLEKYKSNTILLSKCKDVLKQSGLKEIHVANITYILEAFRSYKNKSEKLNPVMKQILYDTPTEELRDLIPFLQKLKEDKIIIDEIIIHSSEGDFVPECLLIDQKDFKAKQQRKTISIKTGNITSLMLNSFLIAFENTYRLDLSDPLLTKRLKKMIPTPEYVKRMSAHTLNEYLKNETILGANNRAISVGYLMNLIGLLEIPKSHTLRDTYLPGKKSKFTQVEIWIQQNIKSFLSANPRL
jgi:hypothetical protein